MLVSNMSSLCPMNSSVPIQGEANIPVSTSDVASIPNIALTIPDFEGYAILRFFSNSSQTEIGCFQAIMRNGASFSHPAAVGSALGGVTAVALVASFATAIYGVSVPQIRTHYAHSLSVLVIFEVFQSIFFSGALSLEWPSVLPAFWSNFAWSAGQIYTKSIIDSVNSFVGISGNSSQAGHAGSTDLNNNGGLQQQIYGRSLGSLERLPDVMSYDLLRKGEEAASQIYKRAVNHTAVQSKMYSWAGTPITPGLPLPGNFSGFAGELAQMGIPAADAFLVGLLWFLILIAILIGATTAFKFSLELFSVTKLIKRDRLALFRSHWLGFLGLIILRTLLIGFFMMMTLTLFQFSYGGRGGVTAIAAIIFIIFFAGMLGVTFYACFYRLRFGKYASEPDHIHFEHKKVMRFIPWFRTIRESSMSEEHDRTKTAGSVSFFRVRFIDSDSERQSVHEDEAYTKRFGWLSARYRRTRWWFFVIWVVYQFVRACFIGGARASPKAQVYGILVWEVIAFVTIAKINPFEGARNTAVAVYMLGLSKVATAGLSIAFLPEYKVARIPTTVIGVVIIVIQGVLVVGLLVLMALGIISSYMSLTRNSEQFKPHSLESVRTKYFDVIELKATDLPPPPPPAPEEPKEPYFTVNAVRRAPKIEDEDNDLVPDIAPQGAPSQAPIVNRGSRANSASSRHSAYGNVPFGARVHRASWSSRDFQSLHDDRADFQVRPQSRLASSHNTANTSTSTQPLIRPAPSQSSLRYPTPTTEQQQQSAGQRVAFAK